MSSSWHIHKIRAANRTCLTALEIRHIRCCNGVYAVSITRNLTISRIVRYVRSSELCQKIKRRDAAESFRCPTVSDRFFPRVIRVKRQIAHTSPILMATTQTHTVYCVYVPLCINPYEYVGRLSAGNRRNHLTGRIQ